ncbi:MAG: Gp15 family bacteriophage protein [Blautia sp.]
MSSFQSQYGIRLSRELPTMKWDEFQDLLIGISPDTALGRMVSIRAENDKNVLKHFTKEQKRIRDAWRNRRAKSVNHEDYLKILQGFEQAFVNMAGR